MVFTAVDLHHVLMLVGLEVTDAAAVFGDDLFDDQVHDTGFDLVDSAKDSALGTDDVLHSSTGEELDN